jgi:hypothetical protein
LNHNGIDVRRVEVLRKFVGTKKDADHIEIDQFDVSRAVRGLIKIAVDGLELHVLQSGKSLFSEGNVDVLVETHSLSLKKVVSNGYPSRLAAGRVHLSGTICQPEERVTMGSFPSTLQVHVSHRPQAPVKGSRLRHAPGCPCSRDTP